MRDYKYRLTIFVAGSCAAFIVAMGSGLSLFWITLCLFFAVLSVIDLLSITCPNLYDRAVNRMYRKAIDSMARDSVADSIRPESDPASYPTTDLLRQRTKDLMLEMRL